MKEAVDAGRKNGVRVIPGIELDTETEQGVDLHILDMAWIWRTGISGV